MKSSTKNEILEEIDRSIHLYHCSGQRYQQLKSVLGRRDPLLVGDALLTYWGSLTNPEADFRAQEFVASLLFALNPTTSLTLKEILSGLSNWNLSVEEFPWYLGLQFGRDRVLEELGTLEAERADDIPYSRAAQTVRYWLAVDFIARRAQY